MSKRPTMASTFVPNVLTLSPARSLLHTSAHNFDMSLITKQSIIFSHFDTRSARARITTKRFGRPHRCGCWRGRCGTGGDHIVLCVPAWPMRPQKTLPCAHQADPPASARGGFHAPGAVLSRPNKLYSQDLRDKVRDMHSVLD